MRLVAGAKGDLHALRTFSVSRRNHPDPARRPEFLPWLTKLVLNDIRRRQWVKGSPFEIACWVTGNSRMIDRAQESYLWNSFRPPVLQSQPVKGLEETLKLRKRPRQEKEHLPAVFDFSENRGTMIHPKGSVSFTHRGL